MGGNEDPFQSQNLFYCKRQGWTAGNLYKIAQFLNGTTIWALDFEQG